MLFAYKWLHNTKSNVNYLHFLFQLLQLFKLLILLSLN